MPNSTTRMPSIQESTTTCSVSCLPFCTASSARARPLVPSVRDLTNLTPAFKSHSHLLKLSLSHALAQSTKLSIYESIMQESLALTSSFPKELSTTGHLGLDRREALKMTGRLFKLRMDVNLIGGILGMSSGLFHSCFCGCLSASST
jgi:uncharacterized Rmd1/YagE family protein